MASKYLNIEEVVELLGIPQEEITRLRESGELRGFADRGTWKFRTEDIEEFARSQQADSSEDGGLGADELPLADDDFDAPGTTSLLDDDDEISADQPTLLQGAVDDEPLLSVDDEPLLSVDDEPLLTIDDASDSDVRLVIDDELEPQDVSESDSDVRLVLDNEPGLAESDSEVQLVADPADVEEVDEMAGSDSDVKLVAAEALDATSLETPRGVDNLDMTEIAEGSGMALEPAGDSGISLEAVAESGISLEGGDESGISLEPSGSGVELGDVTIADSGIALDLDDGSGIALNLDEKTDETQLEVPALVDDGTDFDMAGAGQDEDEETGTDTSVLLFDDEEDADDYSATVVKKSDDADIFDEFGDIGDDDDLDVVDDIFGEDDELADLDVFDADDDVFDDEEQDDDYAVPVEKIAASTEQEWGVGTFLSLLTATGLMLVCGMVLFELVKSIWSAEDPGFSGGLIDTVGQMFN